jgi:hypothetical protein
MHLAPQQRLALEVDADAPSLYAADGARPQRRPVRVLGAHAKTHAQLGVKGCMAVRPKSEGRAWAWTHL